MIQKALPTEGFLFIQKIMEISELYQIYQAHPTVCTDTRTLTPSCLFFCLKGDSFDGNRFAGAALEKGAAYVIADAPECASLGSRCIVVDDVLQTLQALAHYHRSRLSIPVLGITGTNGKTTTKELVTAVLSRAYRVCSTQGNLNNHIGVPLTLLSIREDTEIAVVEMGANHPGEIASLCQIVEPDCALITNVGKAHLEGFGSYEEIVRTKTALYRSVAQKKGMFFVRFEDELLMRQAESLSTIDEVPSLTPWYLDHGLGPDWEKADGPFLFTYGVSEEVQCRGKLQQGGLYLRFDYFGENAPTDVQTHLVGDYNFANAMAALAVGSFFRVPETEAVSAIQSYVPNNSRSQVLEKGNIRFVMDAYNANPSSMEQALNNFARIPEKEKILVLGDMRELGADSVAEHQKVVERISDLGFTEVFLLGDEFSKTRAPQAWKYSSMDDLKQSLLLQTAGRSVCILVKGSRGMRMERVLEMFS